MRVTAVSDMHPVGDRPGFNRRKCHPDFSLFFYSSKGLEMTDRNLIALRISIPMRVLASSMFLKISKAWHYMTPRVTTKIEVIARKELDTNMIIQSKCIVLIQSNGGTTSFGGFAGLRICNTDTDFQICIIFKAAFPPLYVTTFSFIISTHGFLERTLH
jgi:hypothetical protein